MIKKKLRNWERFTIIILIDKRSQIMKNKQFKVGDIFGDVKSTDKFSEGQMNNPYNFLAKLM